MTPPRPPAQGRAHVRRRLSAGDLRGSLAGLLSTGVGLGVGELVAAVVRPEASPAIVVGNRLIRLTPEPVKRWAIRSFGTADKTVLLSGIYAVISVLALLIGLVAARRLRAGVAGIAAFGAFGSYCALTAPAHQATDVLPTAAGTLSAAVALV